MGRVTQAQIAEQAGVSQAMVSMVLAGKKVSSILPETYERIIEVARELGYQPRRVVQRESAPQQNMSIGFLIPRQRSHESLMVYIRRLYTGIFTEIESRHIHLIQAISSENNILPDMIQQQAVRGVIIEDECDVNLVRMINQHVPTVLLNYHHPELDVDSCMPDNAGGIRQAVDHLYALGHRRIAIFGMNPHELHPSERVAGFIRALEMHGLKLRDDYVGFYVTPETYDYSHAEEFTEEQLDRWMGLPDPPTAVVGFCDSHISFLTRAARARNIKVPEELSVIGFDNLPFCDFLEPKLTSIYQPMEQMGLCACRLLLKRIAGSDWPATHVRLGTRIVERESTAPVPVNRKLVAVS